MGRSDIAADVVGALLEDGFLHTGRAEMFSELELSDMVARLRDARKIVEGVLKARGVE